MKQLLAGSGFFLASLMVSAEEGLSGGHWIDLTHELSSETVFWPTAAPFKMTTEFEGIYGG